jgi:rod shape-determining protein MreD
MRLLKMVLYALVIIVLQTVIFVRLNFLGVSPDLILVSVIGYAVLGKRQNSILFAAGSGFMQDILSYGIYLHTITRVVACSLVSAIKENFVGNELSLIAGLVAIFTPLVLIIEVGIYSVFWGRAFDLAQLATTIFIATVYNLIMVPILCPIIKRVSHD